VTKIREGDGEVETAVEIGGSVASRQGLNIPGSTRGLAAVPEEDLDMLRFGESIGVDLVALSFVRTAEDVTFVRRHTRLPLIAKIEKPQAVDAAEEIIRAADCVMVARGDLGIELPIEDVPIVQKQLLRIAGKLARPSITATQMLDSMVNSSRPTRAEVADVANAILDGTDAVMLSAESAAGAYPVEAVETMARIAGYTEAHRSPVTDQALAELRGRILQGPHSIVARSLARVASTVAEELDCKLIVAFTESGMTAQLLSCYRPSAPIAAITYNENTYRRLALWSGVIPVRSVFTANTDEMIARGDEILKRHGLARSGETILMLAGQSNTAGATNMLRVHTVS
jgi:pyruvate kinase